MRDYGFGCEHLDDGENKKGFYIFYCLFFPYLAKVHFDGKFLVVPHTGHYFIKCNIPFVILQFSSCDQSDSITLTQ